MVYVHVPVMVREVIGLLRPRAHEKFLDATLGGGGHAGQLLALSAPDGKVLGLDWDEEALAAAQSKLRDYGDRLMMRRADFTESKSIMRELGWEKVNGLLLDLGVSSYHLESPERGFSFQTEARLDMRMDRRRPVDAYKVVNTLPASELERILRLYGEEPRAHRIALAIATKREQKPIETTTELAEIVASASGKRGGSIHPATRSFQALRIFVNRELENLETFLEDAYELLAPGGRMVAISFHSLEDRLVKKAFRKWSMSCLCPPKTPFCQCGWSRKAKVLTVRPLRPSSEEIQSNPRSRSAKLRAAERI